MKSDNKKKLRRLYYQGKGIIDIWKEIPFLANKKEIAFKPVFIIGCGRSGTTILGDTLAKHTSVCYLNERRDLWHKAYPKLDVWSGKHKDAILFATEKNNVEKRTKKLRRLFFREQVAKKSQILLEKLPINNFRLDFLDAAFPDAKYIYLHRNGLEVAESISKKIPNGWFGYKNLKWKLLSSFGSTHGFEYANEELKSDFHKGIYEWRLSMEQSDEFFKKLSKENYISVSYNNLVENPSETLQKIYNFLDLETTEDLIKQTSGGLKRKNKKILQSEDSITLKIGGDFLIQSVENKYTV